MRCLHEITKTRPVRGHHTREILSGLLHRTVLKPRSLELPRARLAARPHPVHPHPHPGGIGLPAGLYQARIPCKVEMPALPCGMGVCTEFKSPTLKFMKLLAGAEGCMGCMEG